MTDEAADIPELVLLWLRVAVLDLLSLLRVPERFLEPLMYPPDDRLVDVVKRLIFGEEADGRA